MFTVSNKCTTTFMLWVRNHTGELPTLNHLNQSWVKVAPFTTHFMLQVSFNTPWKHLKTCGEYVSASWVMLHKVKIWFCIKASQSLLIVYKSRVFLLNSTICILCDLLFHVVGKQKYGWGYEHHYSMKAEFCRVSEEPSHLYCFLNPFQANGPF